MGKFLDELCDLLDKHKATIVRSANDQTKLVISIQTKSGKFDEIEFNDEIGVVSINHNWYKNI